MGAYLIGVLVAIFHLIAASVIAFYLRRSDNILARRQQATVWLMVGGIVANLIVSVMILELFVSVISLQGTAFATSDDLLAQSLPVFLAVQPPFVLAVGFAVRQVFKSAPAQP